MSQQIKCCDEPTKVICERILELHNYRPFILSMCDKCDTVYKEIIIDEIFTGSNKSIQVLLPNGDMIKVRSDKEWERTGLLHDLQNEDRQTVLDMLKTVDLHYSKREYEHLMPSLVRRICSLIFKHANRNVLLPMVRVVDIWASLHDAERNGRSRAYSKKKDKEVELVRELSDEYVSFLVENIGREAQNVIEPVN
jgi:hypothetical protein